eukprot:1899306-Prymnesium_polylepis.1
MAGARADGLRRDADDHPQEAGRRPLGGRRQLDLHVLRAGLRGVRGARGGHQEGHAGAPRRDAPQGRAAAAAVD